MKTFMICFHFTEDSAGDWIRPECRASFQAEIISISIKIAKGIEIIVYRYIDGLRNSLINVRLNSRLHAQ